ncbi:MAG: cysteine--tRNA ligase [Bacilli bacterium]
MIKIFNSLSKMVEEFKPIRENEVMMYVCGPTVYNNMHIGNSRPIIFFDTVARFFRYLGYRVTYVSNYTDIDDKIINRAKEEGITELEVSEKYIREVEKTVHGLNCLPHDANPKVTENMEGIIKFISLLLEKEGAYVVDGDVYFDVEKVPSYGQLSQQSISNMLNGVRIDPNLRKRNPIDFNLWKATDEGIQWSSPWSKGRPGWHTECVVMINEIFNGKIDIHGGGTDLKFPHHENEIAQAECAFNHTLANYWMHNGRIDLEGEKMSKSLGNVIWANDLLEKVNYQVYRLLILNVPYRQPLSYRPELLEQSKNDFEKIYRSYLTLYRQIELGTNVQTEEDNDVNAIKEEFIQAMSDDFNTANAITAIFKMVKLANNLLREKNPNIGNLKHLQQVFEEMLWVLGMDIKVIPLSNQDKELVNRWHQARKEKNFALADTLRTEINAKGIIL